MRSETIHRIKEAFLVSCFLLFLFSFSGKGINKAERTADKRSQALVLTKQKLVTLPAAALFQWKPVVAQLPLLMHPPRFSLHETISTELSIELSKQTFLDIRPRLLSRLRYQVFHPMDGAA